MTPTVGGRRLYVYYRVEPVDAAAAVAAVRELQGRLCEAHPGLQADVLRRPPVPGQPVTLMETYTSLPGIDDALAAEIERAATMLPPGRLGDRHVEVFETAD